MLPNLLEQLTGEWREAITQANILLEEPLDVLKVAGASGLDRKINFLVFSRGAPSPSLLMKLTRSLRSYEKLREEFETLESVCSIAAIKGTVPEPIGIFPFGNTYVLLETCVPGVSLKSLLTSYRHLGRAQVRKDLEIARDWLTVFQKATRQGEVLFAGQVEVQKRRERGRFELPSEFMDHLLLLAKEAQGMKIPLCARHGDFWPGNLLLTRAGCGVIDWEGYAPSALPFVDVFSFAITYSWSYSWQGLVDLRRKDAFARAFLKHNWLSAALRTFMEDLLCLPLGMHPKFLRLFFSLFLMDMAAPHAEEKAMHTTHTGLWRDQLDFYAKHALEASQI